MHRHGKFVGLLLVGEKVHDKNHFLEDAPILGPPEDLGNWTLQRVACKSA